MAEMPHHGCAGRVNGQSNESTCEKAKEQKTTLKLVVVLFFNRPLIYKPSNSDFQILLACVTNNHR